MFGKSELANDVLILPAPPADLRASDLAVPSARKLETLLRASLKVLRTSAERGDATNVAVCALLPKDGLKTLPAVAKGIIEKSPASIEQTEPDIDDLAPLLYLRAVEKVAKDAIGEAIVALALVANSQAGRADALLGLAICAARQQNYEIARILALESLKLRPGHPRACCIAGRCELERGDRKAAQHYLAIATRMARRRPEFRDDLRAAQRLLLMMHIA